MALLTTPGDELHAAGVHVGVVGHACVEHSLRAAVPDRRQHLGPRPVDREGASLGDDSLKFSAA